MPTNKIRFSVATCTAPINLLAPNLDCSNSGGRRPARQDRGRCAAGARATLGDLSEREHGLFIEMMQRIVAGTPTRDSVAALFE